MHGKKFLFLAGFVALILATSVGAAWAVGNADYNRPNPLMDYVPQENGIYDTRYDYLVEDDCRACHGDSLADRHHYSNIVLIYNRCTDCHEILPEPPGVLVIRDCTTSGCHSWDDVGEMDDSGVPPNGWHHSTDLSGSENCVACHDRNFVAEITPFSSFQQYPPSVVTPTPFSCENCHWDQDVMAAQVGFDGTQGTANLAGHPSTFDHQDQWGNAVGYYEYGKPILSNWDNHHQGIWGNVAPECQKCHANDPNSPNWDPTDLELIRYCEICHDVSTLHTIFEHVGPPGTGGGDAVNGWEKVGFHVPGSPLDEPVVYRTFEANEQCFGCHGDAVPTIDLVVNVAPAITAIEPTAGCPGALVTLTGTNFDPETIGQIVGREVQFKISGNWTDVFVHSWTDTQIVFEVPAWTMAPGNYLVRVFDDNRVPAANKKSNSVGFTVKDCNSPTTITPDSGPCTTNNISLAGPTGIGFGAAQDTLTAAGGTDGVFRVVQVSASQGNYIALQIASWANTEVKFKFKRFFEDLDGDYFQDANEPTIEWCDGLALGTWNVFIKYIFYGDTDSSGAYSDGDIMYQVESSNPLVFELTDDPYVTALNPTTIVKGSKLRIIGVNFGPTQQPGDEVRIGKKSQYDADPLNKGNVLSNVKLWSSTKIVVKFKQGVKNAWIPSTKYVWVVKDGQVSNRSAIKIIP